MRSIRKYLRKRLVTCAPCYAFYTQTKYRLANLISLHYFLQDALDSWHHMYWGDASRMTTGQLQANLLFYYHKIEKGLSLPGKMRLFGLEVIPKITTLIEVWETTRKPKDDPIYVGAINSLRAYYRLISTENLDPAGAILPFVDSFLSKRTHISAAIPTPVNITREELRLPISYDEFLTLCQARRSFRKFSDELIPDEIIKRSIAAAQLSPSACNRQPCKVYAVRDESLKRAILTFQNGNAGFGHLAPLVMVITADAQHFFGPIERHEPYIDGGLFTMSLLFGLQVQGLVSCCLNWCVTPTSDSRVHSILEIPKSEKIVMFLLAGFPSQETTIPKSHRKLVETVFSFK
jgi:nitroreductase